MAAAGGAGDSVRVPLGEAAAGEPGADGADVWAGDGGRLARGAGAAAVDRGAPAGVQQREVAAGGVGVGGNLGLVTAQGIDPTFIQRQFHTETWRLVC